jgi:hypothetical protein
LCCSCLPNQTNSVDTSCNKRDKEYCTKNENAEVSAVIVKDVNNMIASPTTNDIGMIVHSHNNYSVFEHKEKNPPPHNFFIQVENRFPSKLGKMMIGHHHGGIVSTPVGEEGQHNHVTQQKNFEYEALKTKLLQCKKNGGTNDIDSQQQIFFDDIKNFSIIHNSTGESTSVQTFEGAYSCLQNKSNIREVTEESEKHYESHFVSGVVQFSEQWGGTCNINDAALETQSYCYSTTHPVNLTVMQYHMISSTSDQRYYNDIACSSKDYFSFPRISKVEQYGSGPLIQSKIYKKFTEIHSYSIGTNMGHGKQNMTLYSTIQENELLSMGTTRDYASPDEDHDNITKINDGIKNVNNEGCQIMYSYEWDNHHAEIDEEPSHDDQGCIDMCVHKNPNSFCLESQLSISTETKFDDEKSLFMSPKAMTTSSTDEDNSQLSLKSCLFSISESIEGMIDMDELDSIEILSSENCSSNMSSDSCGDNRKSQQSITNPYSLSREVMQQEAALSCDGSIHYADDNQNNQEHFSNPASRNQTFSENLENSCSISISDDTIEEIIVEYTKNGNSYCAWDSHEMVLKQNDDSHHNVLVESTSKIGNDRDCRYDSGASFRDENGWPVETISDNSISSHVIFDFDSENSDAYESSFELE